jgi:hypothetical protein
MFACWRSADYPDVARQPQRDAAFAAASTPHRAYALLWIRQTGTSDPRCITTEFAALAHKRSSRAHRRPARGRAWHWSTDIRPPRLKRLVPPKRFDQPTPLFACPSSTSRRWGRPASVVLAFAGDPVVIAVEALLERVKLRADERRPGEPVGAPRGLGVLRDAVRVPRRDLGAVRERSLGLSNRRNCERGQGYDESEPVSGGSHQESLRRCVPKYR